MSKGHGGRFSPREEAPSGNWNVGSGNAAEEDWRIRSETLTVDYGRGRVYNVTEVRNTVRQCLQQGYLFLGVRKGKLRPNSAGLQEPKHH